MIDLIVDKSAITFGHRTIVDLLLKQGAPRSSQLLICALNRQNGPVFPMVQPLISAGCVVNQDVALKCDEYAKPLLRPEASRLEDGVATVVLIGHEMMNCIPRTISSTVSNIGLVMTGVLRGAFEVSEPDLLSISPA